VNGAAVRKENGKEVEVFARKMRRSLGDKRNELAEEHIVELARLAQAFEASPTRRSSTVRNWDTARSRWSVRCG
jgi:hypothetical protein